MSIEAGVDNKALKDIKVNTEETKDLMEKYLSKSVELLGENTELLREIRDLLKDGLKAPNSHAD